jgi:hypothetical protein
MVEAKLTKEDVKTIYRLLEKSHTAKDLARRYGVDRTTIWRNDMYDNTLCVFNNDIHSSTNCHEMGKMAEKEERIYHIPKEKMMEKHETTVF